MNAGIQLIIDTLLLGNIESIVVGTAFLSSILFTVKDFKLMPLMAFVLNSGILIWFYQANLNFTLPLYGLLVSFVLMVLLFIPVNTTSSTGGLT